MPENHEVPAHRSCGSSEVHHRLLENRSYQQNRIDIERYTSRFMLWGASSRRAGPVTIPVVVHVVFSTPAGNISDAQVQSQIDALNRDYSATNPDRANVPAVWAHLIGDPQIQFSLATVDPSGKPTNGITRTQTTVPSFSTNDKVKSSLTGGADPWPSKRFLNLWVCMLGGGLLGYAQFPGGPVATDGVVILHTAFGTMGTAHPPFNLGRTTTHEVGHWLNLIHIWGDRLDCSGTDLVDDTPAQQAPNYHTPTFPHTTCNNGVNGDMFMNYMDYVDDQTMVMFTVGQVARMNATLDGPRSSLLGAEEARVRDIAMRPVNVEYV